MPCRPAPSPPPSRRKARKQTREEPEGWGRASRRRRGGGGGGARNKDDANAAKGGGEGEGGVLSNFLRPAQQRGPWLSRPAAAAREPSRAMSRATTPPGAAGAMPSAAPVDASQKRTCARVTARCGTGRGTRHSVVRERESVCVSFVFLPFPDVDATQRSAGI